MGKVAAAIGDFFEDVVAVVTVVLMVAFPFISTILATVCDECEEFMSDQWEVVLGWLGITDQDIFSVQMQDQKLINDGTFYKNLMTQVALEHQATQLGIIELLAVKSQGIRGSLQKYSAYGKKTYVEGLPDTTINTIAVDNDTIDAAITAERGFAIDVLSIKTKVPKETEWVSYRMTQLYGYIASTDVFVYNGDSYTLTGFYYDFLNGVYKATGTLIASPFTAIEIDIGNYVPNIGYVVHYLKSGTTEEYYWVYFLNSGNGELDRARKTLTNLDMLPIVELRRAGVSVDSDKTSLKYTQGKEILGIIGIDLDTMLTSLHSNADISSVTAAYIYFGAELGSNNPLQAKLVYNILEFLWQDPSVVSDGSHSIRVTEGDYNSAISWERQTRIVEARSGVPIGRCEGGVGTEVGATGNKYYGWVRRQETADEYVEYRVYNVSAITIIMKSGLKDATFQVLSPEQTIVMPMSQHFVKKFSPIEQGKLFPEILRLVTYAADVQHLRYYQTAAFFQLIQIVVIVIAVVLFVLTIYAGGGGAAAWLAAVEGALYAMAVAYAISLLLRQIDNPYLRAVAAGVIMGLMFYSGNIKGGSDAGLMMASIISEMVTNFADASMENTAELMMTLSMESATAQSIMEAKDKEMEEKQKSMESYMSLEDVLKVSQLDNFQVRRDSIDAFYYRAGPIMYDMELTKSMKSRTALYNYDELYKVGSSID